MKIESILNKKVNNDNTLTETTSAGSVASVSAPVGGMQRRAKGSIFSGIKTSEKFPNSKAVKEAQLDEINPQNYDSDEDYYDDLEAEELDLSKFGRGWDIPDEIASLQVQLRHAKSQYERDQIENKIKRYEDIYYGEDDLEESNLNEKSKSKAQFRMMAAVANNPEFAKKVGINQSVGKEFHKADKKQDYKDLPKEIDEAGASTKSFRAGYSKRKETKPLSPEEQLAKDKAKADKWLEKERAKMAAKKGVAEEKKKGADGKACWDGYRYNGTEDGSDKCIKVSEAEFTEDKLALDLYKDLQIFKKGADKDIGSKAKDKDLGKKPQDKEVQKKK